MSSWSLDNNGLSKRPMMSTFDGVVEEFPGIRIDYFRKIPDVRPPLACFLSHVHSDHLHGLESLRSPFVYCSAATRELLLRLEKFPHRMNFAKGILETRKVHYKHLDKLLKAIPLNSPTEIELAPGRTIRVTLFDANHCTGAVMFLIDNATNAVLYTGDIRAETWWVNSLARDPILIPYTNGLRRLDKIYLDTTFATKEDTYRQFPTKADGIQELLTKVTAYPKDTVFYFNSWTFGYEDVWRSLASVLGSQIHVDRYKWRLYKALAKCSNAIIAPHEGAALCGFQCGNRFQAGCLTENETARLHTCERGAECNTLKNSKSVMITPIITRSKNGEELLELGAGGGGGDLEPAHQVDLNDATSAIELIKLCSETIHDTSARTQTLALISEALASDSKAISLNGILGSAEQLEDMPLATLATILKDMAAEKPSHSKQLASKLKNSRLDMERTSKNITFPYSRHSSYAELCHLIEIFKPMDVYPCTVDESAWDHNVSMRRLFGPLCSKAIFAHDAKMTERRRMRDATRSKKRQFDTTQARVRTETTDDTHDSSGELAETSRTHSDKNASTAIGEPISKKICPGSSIEDRTPVRSLNAAPRITTPSTTTSDGKHIKSIRNYFEATVDSKATHFSTKNANSLERRVDESSAEQSDHGYVFTEAARDPVIVTQQHASAGSRLHSEEASTTASDSDFDRTESQLSLPDSAFASEQFLGVSTHLPPQQVVNRKEAYKAALGRDGLDWATYSPISSGKVKSEEDLVLV